MTYLPATVAGRWFYLYLILDLYSRKIVGWEVHETDAAEHAAHLVRRAALAEGHHGSRCQAGSAWRQRRHAQGHDRAGDAALASKPVVLAPRVCPMTTLMPRALFRTAKYRPEFPAKGFDDLDAARLWASQLCALVQL